MRNGTEKKQEREDSALHSEFRNADKVIGIFDSGVGGLTVVREVIRELPHESVVYFGDTARVPYGTKSGGLVRRYGLQDARFLTRFGVKLIVVACNTVSAIGLGELSREMPVRVMGVVEPGCRTAVGVTKTGKIGVLGTEATISSGVYPETLKKFNSGVEVMSVSCPLFVPIVEEGWVNREVAELTAREYLSPLKGEVDTLILGCTHYPLLKNVIGKEMGDEVTLVDSSREVAVEVKGILGEEDNLVPVSYSGSHRYFVSDHPEKFGEMARVFLGEEIISVEKVDIEEY